MRNKKINSGYLGCLKKGEGKRQTLFTLFSFFILFVLYPQISLPQETVRLTIEEAYTLAQKNYPLIKQHELIKKAAVYSVTNASKGYLPVLSFNAQGTYQSDVTSFPFKLPIGGITLPQYSKDQYKIYGEVDQLIYDGGNIRTQERAAEISEMVQQQNLEVELFSIYARVNELFFGIVLIDEQLKLNDLTKKDIQNGIDKIKAQLENGMAYKSSMDELSAQLLQAEQSRTGLSYLQQAYADMLRLFINVSPGQKIAPERPPAPVLSETITRPELLLYDYQKKNYDIQEGLLHVQLRPHISFFLQGGYARPALNVLDNNFEWYYIGGLRFNWNLGSLYTLKNQERIIAIQKNSLQIEKETFLFNTNMLLKQQRKNIDKYEELLKKDDAIVSLRESVKKTAAVQLENGVLTAHDYITQVNAEDQARQNRVLDEIQWLQAKYNYQNITGNIVK